MLDPNDLSEGIVITKIFSVVYRCLPRDDDQIKSDALDEFEFRFLIHGAVTVQLSTPRSLLIIKADLLFTEIKSGEIYTSRCLQDQICKKVEQITH